jgi:hypothetical protein
MLGTGSKLLSMPRSSFVPCFSTMDQGAEFAVLCLGWNEHGLGLTLDVAGKEQPVVADPNLWTSSDGLSLWIDTRDSRAAHRAGRFCQRFLFVPDDGSGKQIPGVRRYPIKRAQEEPPAIDETQIRLVGQAYDEDGELVPMNKVKVVRGYRLEAFLPHTVLSGFDPENNRRLGFFYRVRDRELGDQIFSGVREIPYWEDPSLWATLILEPPTGARKK